MLIDLYNQDTLKQKDILEEAASYIRKLRERTETLDKEKNEMKMKMSNQGKHMIDSNDRKVVVQVHSIDDCMEIVLMSTLNKSFKLHEVIRILGEEGAEVIHANLSTWGDKINVHTIHSRVFPKLLLYVTEVYLAV